MVIHVFFRLWFRVVLIIGVIVILRLKIRECRLARHDSAVHVLRIPPTYAKFNCKICYEIQNTHKIVLGSVTKYIPHSVRAKLNSSTRQFFSSWMVIPHEVSSSAC